MTFGEGAALHQERGGSAVFARYAFNELVSFVAGWSIVLDYTILIAVTALTVPAYLAAFWGSIGHGAPQLIVAIAVIAFVLIDNVTGVSAHRLRALGDRHGRRSRPAGGGDRARTAAGLPPRSA